MIGAYLTQTATLRRSTGVTADGTHTFSDVPIVCRFQPTTRKFISTFKKDYGETIVSQATVFTTSEIHVGDVIVYGGNSYPVQRVFERWGFASRSHYEVWL